MSQSDKQLRHQIAEGMAAIRRQIEVLREGPTMGDPSNDITLIAELEAEYLALKQARSELGGHTHAPDASDEPPSA